jgi:hypothetical protein
MGKSRKVVNKISQERFVVEKSGKILNAYLLGEVNALGALG